MLDLYDRHREDFYRVRSSGVTRTAYYDAMRELRAARVFLLAPPGPPLPPLRLRPALEAFSTAA